MRVSDQHSFLGQTIISGAIVAFCVGAAVLLWFPVGSAPDRSPAIVSMTDGDDELAVIRTRIAANAEALSAYPLLHASRRPPQAPEPTPAPQAPPPVVSLKGILDDGAARVALISISDQAVLHRVEVGGRLRDMKVLAIGEKSVLLQNDSGERLQLAMGD